MLTLSLSGERTQRELTELADKIVKTQLERSAGVGEIDIDGDTERTINIWVDAERLAAYQIPITAVRDATVRQNTEIPGGNVTGALREQTLRTLGRLTDAEAFNDIVIATVNGAPIRVRDVGRAEDGVREERSVARLNGKPTVALEVRRQSGANTVEVIEAVKENLQRVRDQLPPGVEMQIIRDQSTFIYAALHEINVHLILGSVLASLVVLAFMRSWRSTIIAAIAIPTSVISTFAVMWALDFTLNSVTMLALVLMVGIVIDDAIVVLENIFRFVEEKGMTPMEAAKHGTGEIALAVLATTLSLVVIFIPVSFMSSISGRFLYQFGITAAAAVLVSLLVSFTLTPMLSARMLKVGKGGHGGGHDGGGHEGAGSRGGFYGYIDRGYTWMLKLAMRFRWGVAVIALLVMASSVPLYTMVQQDYLPTDIDEAEFDMRITLPEGASFTTVNEAMQAIEADLLEMPQVRTILASAGGGFLGGVNQGEIYVRIAPHDERIFSLGRLWRETLNGDPMAAFRGNYSQRDVMQQIRAEMRKYTDLRVSVRNFPSFNIGGGNYEIDFVVRGPELERLFEYTNELRTRAQQIGGFTDMDTTLKLDKPELRVNIDRERAADLGVSTQDVGTALRLMVGGDTEISRFRDPATNEDYDVQLRLSEQDRNEAGEVPQLYLSGRDEQLVELRNLATIEEANAATRASTASAPPTSAEASRRAMRWPTGSKPCSRPPTT